MVTVVAVLSCAVWIYLIFLHGGFWRADQWLPPSQPKSSSPPVVAVIPARNEADVIDRSICSLLQQDYPQPFPIVLVNDSSDDATAAEALRAAERDGGSSRLFVLDAPPKPPVWTGKVWAMAQGVEQAEALEPEARYILLCDADIEHGAGNLRRLVQQAEAGEFDLVSLMVMLSARGFWSRLLIPPFVFFFQMLYPFPRVNNPASKTAAAAGGCMLVRRSALHAAGGLAAIRDALIDDCALARSIADAGGKLWLGLTSEVHSIRPYAGFRDIWNMVARSAYTQLGHSPIRLGVCVMAMAVVYGAPAWLAFAPNRLAAAMALAACIMMLVAYYPTVRLYRQPAAAVLLLPFSAVLYTIMTVASAWRHWRGRGGGWKGRINSR